MRKPRGFTLIEILIVMLIISIVAGVAVVTMGSNQNKKYETMAHQFTNMFMLAEQEAMLRPAILGLAFTTHSFQFYVFQRNNKTGKNNWVAIKQAALGVHRMPDNTQITLKIQDKIIPADGQPKLIISPSNDLTPFVILIGKPHETPYYQVLGKENGEVVSERFSAE